MAQGLIGVTGATGELGGRVARLLAERGLEQRLVVRDPARAPKLEGVTVARIAGYDAGEEMRRALDGVETLLFISAEEHEHRLEQLHKPAIDAAVAAGVGRIVYTSFLGAAPDATFTLGRDHFHTEEHIRASGVDFAFSRNSIYLDYVPLFAGADGVIRGPAGQGRISAVARDDIAEVIAALIVDRGHDGEAVGVTGREAFTMDEAAARISEAIGADVRFVDETMEEARESRAHFNAPDWEVAAWVTTYSSIAVGEVEKVTDTIERLTGHQPMNLEEFLKRYPASYQHLVGAE
jgi:NAD(P)H dehydrogenase (quinone)